MTYAIPSYFVWLIFVLPFVGALVTVSLRKAGRLGDYVAVAFSFLSALFATTMVLPFLEGQPLTVNSVPPLSTSVPWISGLNLTFGVLTDPYTAVLTSVIAWVSFLIVLYSIEYMKDDGGHNRYFFFITLFIGSMQLIILSDNLLSLFIGWEMVGLCSYALIGHYWKDETKDWVGTPGDKVLGEDQAYSPSQAGMKAFVMTRIGDVAMLAGILMLFYYSGTFNYYQLAADHGSWFQHLYSNGLLVPVGLLIFGGAVGKSAQFPLHEWLPDAMAGPAPVSALIHAATMVKAGVVLVARVAPIFYFVVATGEVGSAITLGSVQPFFMAIAWIGAFTAFLAASQALVGYELKKILAYSTVSQIGYMMLAVGVAGLSTDFAQGLSAALYQLMSHAIFKATLFLAAGALIHAADSKYITEMGGMRNKMKVTFAAFLISAASLSGIPPFSGFWSKDAVLGAAWSAGQYALFAVGAVTAGLTVFYSFRMLGLVFLGDRSKRASRARAQPYHVGPVLHPRRTDRHNRARRHRRIAGPLPEHRRLAAVRCFDLHPLVLPGRRLGGADRRTRCGPRRNRRPVRCRRVRRCRGDLSSEEDAPHPFRGSGGVHARPLQVPVQQVVHQRNLLQGVRRRPAGRLRLAERQVRLPGTLPRQ